MGCCPRSPRHGVASLRHYQRGFLQCVLLALTIADGAFVIASDNTCDASSNVQSSHVHVLDRAVTLERFINELEEEQSSVNSSQQEMLSTLDSQEVQMKEMTDTSARMALNSTTLAAQVKALALQTTGTEEIAREVNATVDVLEAAFSTTTKPQEMLNASVSAAKEELATLNSTRQLLSAFGLGCWGGGTNSTLVSTLSPLCKMFFQECWLGKIDCTIAQLSHLSWSSSPVAEISGLYDPFGIHVAPSGTIFLVQYDDSTSTSVGGVKRFEGNSTMQTLVTQGFVRDVAFQEDGGVVYTGGANLWRLPPGGGSPIKLQEFQLAVGVAVARNGDIIVSDHTDNKIYRCPPNITTSGNCKEIASGLNFPWSVQEAGNGDIIVADRSNDRIVRIPAQGGSISTLATGLTLVRDIAVTPQGHVVIAQNNGAIKLCRIEASNPNTCSSVDTIAADMVFNTVLGIALAPNGDIIVSDRVANTVYRLPFQGSVH